MNYLVKNNNKITILTAVTAVPILPQDFELLGSVEELNPNNLKLDEAELQEVEIRASYQALVSPAIEAVEAKEAVLNDEGEIIEPAIEAVSAQAAVYETVPALRGMRMVMSATKARANKLVEIRAIRDAKLEDNDKAWLIATKKHENTVSLETAAQVLRDLPEVAATALAELETLEEINAYDAFGE